MYPGAHLAHPSKPSVIMAGSGEVVTYRQLEDRSVQIGHHFRQLGLRPGDHIALVSTNHIEVFAIYWAAMRSGLLLTAVNCHLTPSEIAYIVDDCDARLLIFSASLAHKATHDDVLEHIPKVTDRQAFGGEIPGYLDLHSATDRLSTHPESHQPRGADMLYSSGTTGRPKGITPELPDRQVHEPGDTVTGLGQTMWSMDPSSVYLSPAPLYHAAPLRTCAAVQALGGTVVLMERFDAEDALRAIEDHRITHSQWVPTMFVRMLKLPEEERLRYDVSSMRVAIHAAAPCPEEIKRAMIDWWGPIIVEYYSSTELSGMTMISAAEWLDHPGSVGRDDVLGTAHICGEDGAELAPGQVGVIYFERDELPFRYHKDPDQTRGAQHPDHPSWTTTGDLGHLDEDRYLYLTERQSFVIISGGVNVYPQEIEGALTVHPGVLDVAVVGEPDAEMGETVLALIQPTPGTTDPEGLEAALREFVRSRLATFKHPRRYLIVDDLPRTPTGKLAKNLITL